MIKRDSKSNYDLPLYSNVENETDVDKILAADVAYSAFKNNGTIFDESGRFVKNVSYANLLTRQDILETIPPVIEQITYENLYEEMTILPTLFQKIDLPDTVQKYNINTLGELDVQRVPADGEGEIGDTMQFKGSSSSEIVFTPSGWGIGMSITESALKVAPYDIIGSFTRAASRAFARNREDVAVKTLLEGGYVVKSNVGDSELGCLTGRDMTLAQNGAMTFADLLDIMEFAHYLGMNIDTMLVNPLAFKMFKYDPDMKELIWDAPPAIGGSYAPGWKDPHMGFGYRSTGTGYGPGADIMSTPSGRVGANPFTSQMNPINNTIYIAPRGPFPLGLKIISTYRMPYRKNAGSWTDGSSDHATHVADTTDIIFADSKNCGVFGLLTNPKIDRMSDNWLKQIKIRMFEAWDMQLKNQGKGIFAVSDVLITRPWNFEVTATTSIPSELDSSLRFVTET